MTKSTLQRLSLFMSILSLIFSFYVLYKYYEKRDYNSKNIEGMNYISFYVNNKQYLCPPYTTGLDAEKELCLGIIKQ